MTQPMDLTILLCDDHGLVLDGLAALMAREGWRVVAQTTDGAEAVQLAAALKPDVAVIDVSMPGMNGIDTATQIRADLVGAIHGILRGETFISPALAAGASRAAQRSANVDQASLTEREREMLRLLAHGQRTKDITTGLGISAKTVETYRSRVMLKLGIENLPGLVRFAIRAGIAPVE